MVTSLQTQCTPSSLAPLHLSGSSSQKACFSARAAPIVTSGPLAVGHLTFSRDCGKPQRFHTNVSARRTRSFRGRGRKQPVDVTASSSSEALGGDVGGDVGGDEAAGQAEKPPQGFWPKVKAFLAKFNAAEVRAKVAKLGPAAVLAYGLFDGITYTTFFVITFLGYEARTGQNPTANLKNLLAILVVMWGGNNFTRPFRLAGAAILAPYIDSGLQRLQKALKLPSAAFAFLLVTATFASLCLSVVGLLILSRLGR